MYCHWDAEKEFVVADSNFSDADPWGIPLEEAQATSDDPVAPLDEKADAAAERVDTSVALAPDVLDEDDEEEMLMFVADTPEPAADVEDDPDQDLPTDDQVVADPAISTDIGAESATEEPTPSPDTDQADGQSPEADSDLDMAAAGSSDVAVDDSAVHVFDAVPGYGELEVSGPEGDPGDEPPSPDTAADTAAGSPRRTGFGLSRMLAAAQSAFRPEDSQETPPAAPDEDLPDDLPSWAVSDDADSTDEVFSAFGSLGSDDRTGRPAAIPADDQSPTPDEPPAVDANQPDQEVVDGPGLEDAAAPGAQALTDDSSAATVDPVELDASQFPEDLAELPEDAPADDIADALSQLGEDADDGSVESLGDQDAGHADQDEGDLLSIDDAHTPVPEEPVDASVDLASSSPMILFGDVEAADEPGPEEVEVASDHETSAADPPAPATAEDDDAVTSDDPWGEGGGAGPTSEDSIDVPISSLPVPSIYQDLEHLPPIITDHPVADARAASPPAHSDTGSERWDESVQGWIENDDGEPAWRPIISTAESLSPWTIETYLGIVTGDASVEPAGDIDGLAAARDAALDIAVADAVDRGGHAVTGVKFAVHEIGASTIVTASGTAVTLRSPA